MPYSRSHGPGRAATRPIISLVTVSFNQEATFPDAYTTLDSRKAQTIEKQSLNLLEGSLPWKIFISLLKSTCSFEKERYFRTPFFRKEKR
jgi:hypothetical protein